MAPPLHPCFQLCSLQDGTKFVAIAEIIWGVLILLWLLGEFLNAVATLGFGGYFSVLYLLGPVWPIIIIVSLIAHGLLGALMIIFGLILFKASNERDQRKCKLWLFAQIAAMVLIVLMSLRYSFVAVAFIVSFGPLKVYFGWVVYSFMKELQDGVNEDTIPDGPEPDAADSEAVGRPSNTGTALSTATKGEQ